MGEGSRKPHAASGRMNEPRGSHSARRPLRHTPRAFDGRRPRSSEVLTTGRKRGCRSVGRWPSLRAPAGGSFRDVHMLAEPLCHTPHTSVTLFVSGASAEAGARSGFRLGFQRECLSDGNSPILIKVSNCSLLLSATRYLSRNINVSTATSPCTCPIPADLGS